MTTDLTAAVLNLLDAMPKDHQYTPEDLSDRLNAPPEAVRRTPDELELAGVLTLHRNSAGDPVRHARTR